MAISVRNEAPADHAAVREINLLAFGGPGEADLVDALRGRATPCVSLVAEVAGRVVGHLILSPVTLDGHPALRTMGLAPMAVLPDHQGTGVGSALVRAGLEACRTLGAEVVVVLGHPTYYPRFGFAPASRLGLRCVYDAPDEAFMALELTPGALAGRAGLVRFHPAFDDLPEA